MRKIFIVLVILYNSLDAGIIMDIDKKTCINECDKYDLACNEIQLKLCKIMLSTAYDTVETESIKRFTQWAGSALAQTGKVLVKAGVYKTKKEAYEKLGSNIIYFGNIFKKNGGLLITNNEKRMFDSSALIEFAIDATFDIVSNEIIENYDSIACSKIRSLPLIDDNADDETIKQALKWMVKLSFNDLKATLYYGTGHYIDAAGAGVVDNSLLLADIGVKTTHSAKEYFNSSTALAMSKKRGQILNLYYKYEGPYLRLRKSNPDEYKIKQKMPNEFLTKCKKIKLDLDEFIIANWAKPLEGYGPKLNKSLNDECNKYYYEMQKNNYMKKYILSNALTHYSKTRYNKMIEYYFNHDDWHYYKKLYNVYNFDPKIGYPKNSAFYKYVKQVYAYGVDYYSYGLFSNYAGEYGSIKDAAGDISNALKEHFNIKKSVSKIINDARYSNNTILTRHKYGKLLIYNFGLNNISLNKNQKATYLQLIKKGISETDARISALKIIYPAYKSQSIYNMRIKYYQMLQMISDSLDVVTCGHKGCSYEEILKGGN